MKILIIDDDADINVLSKVALEANKHEVLQAFNGYQGIETAREHYDEIDVIILDIMMPDLDGFEVLEILKNDPKTQSIPVVFLSARKFSDETLLNYENMIVSFIAKPFELSDFIKKIEGIVKN